MPLFKREKKSTGTPFTLETQIPARELKTRRTCCLRLQRAAVRIKHTAQREDNMSAPLPPDIGTYQIAFISFNLSNFKPRKTGTGYRGRHGCAARNLETSGRRLQAPDQSDNRPWKH